MKQKSLIQIIKDRGYGQLKSFITFCPNGDGKMFYVGHIYGSADDDTSHWYVKRRSIITLLKAMEKQLTKLKVYESKK